MGFDTAQKMAAESQRTIQKLKEAGRYIAPALEKVPDIFNEEIEAREI